MKCSIDLKKILLYGLIVIPTVKTSVIQESVFWNGLYNIWIVIDFLIIVSLFVLRKHFPGANFWKIESFFIIILFSTIYNSGESIGCFAEVLRITNLLLLCETELKKNGIYVLLKYLNFYIKIILVVDIFSIFVGYIVGGQQFQIFSFLGMDNYAIFFIFPMLVIAFYYDYLRLNKLKFNTMIIFGLCLFCKLATNAVSAELALLFFICMIVFSKHVKGYINIINSRSVLLVIVLFMFGIVFFNVQNYFADFIIDILHKDVTLSTRTYIWKRCIQAIPNSWLIGYGQTNVEKFKKIVGLASYEAISHTHNFVLEVIFRGGVIALCSLGYIFVEAWTSNNKKECYSKNILSFGVCGFLILMITDAYIMIPWIYLVLYFMMLKEERELYGTK